MNIPQYAVEEVVYQYYKNIADHIEAAEYGEVETFLNFSIPRVGKLFTKDARVMKIHDNIQKRKAKNESKNSD